MNDWSARDLQGGRDAGPTSGRSRARTAPPPWGLGSGDGGRAGRRPAGPGDVVFDPALSVWVNDVLIGQDRLSNMAWSFVRTGRLRLPRHLDLGPATCSVRAPAATRVPGRDLGTAWPRRAAGPRCSVGDVVGDGRRPIRLGHDPQSGERSRSRGSRGRDRGPAPPPRSAAGRAAARPAADRLDGGYRSGPRSRVRELQQHIRMAQLVQPAPAGEVVAGEPGAGELDRVTTESAEPRLPDRRCDVRGDLVIEACQQARVPHPSKRCSRTAGWREDARTG